MDQKDRSPQEWEKLKWIGENGNPSFHFEDYTKALVKHHSELFEDGETGRVFVPLCGKTLDMIFLANEGHEVIGVEFSTIPIRSFFKENNLNFTEEKVMNAPFVKFTAHEKKVSIFQGDLFEFDAKISGKFDASWDCGSFDAINVSAHKKYATLMADLLKAGGKILMETCVYDTLQFSGPPHNITGENLSQNFADFDLKSMGFRAGRENLQSDFKFDLRISLLTRK